MFEWGVPLGLWNHYPYTIYPKSLPLVRHAIFQKLGHCHGPAKINFGQAPGILPLLCKWQFCSGSRYELRELKGMQKGCHTNNLESGSYTSHNPALVSLTTKSLKAPKSDWKFEIIFQCTFHILKSLYAFRRVYQALMTANFTTGNFFFEKICFLECGSDTGVFSCPPQGGEQQRWRPILEVHVTHGMHAGISRDDLKKHGGQW